MLIVITVSEIYFNPRAPRGARHVFRNGLETIRIISIHVPREGHDDARSAPVLRLLLFQSTCPARGTTRWDLTNRVMSVFQSTCPARGTTRYSAQYLIDDLFQSTCPARGTTYSLPGEGCKYVISIHVPREGHDTRSVTATHTIIYFNPRAPRGARRRGSRSLLGRLQISIHVPREGHDSKHAQFFRADLRKSYKYPAERDALPTKNVCKHIKTLG